MSRYEERMHTPPTQPLDPTLYARFGDVLGLRSDRKPSLVNLDTAQRFNHLVDLQNLRPDAVPNFSFFRCDPTPQNPFRVHLLEKHPYSTQVFIPMNGVTRYLLIVALGDEQPDLNQLGVFIATGHQGVSYRPGVWHHPLIALDRLSDFSCLVWEDGSAGDCVVHSLSSPFSVTY